MRRRYFVFFLFLILTGCGKDSESPTETVRMGDPDRGRRIYLANCIACHSSDPSKDGSVAPPVKGASKELLEARILRATYPAGYAPKRKSTSKPAYPFLKSAIPDLAAFLVD